MPKRISTFSAGRAIVAAVIAALAATQALGRAAEQPDAPESPGEPLLEELRRDEWKGAPSTDELGRAAPDTDSLELTRDRGWLFAPRTYSDFTLEYEMRLSETGRHRVFFRTLAWPEDSYELRIESRKGRQTASLMAQRQGGKDTDVRIASDLLSSALAGHEWHRVRIRADEARAEIDVNGTTLLNLDGLHILSGRIGFAGEGVGYRRATLRTHGRPEPFRSAYLAQTEGLEPPTVVREVKPNMPERARKQPVNYVALIEAVVDESGDVMAARFVRRLNEDLGYNQEAMRAVMQWKFTPGRLNGKPVHVVVTIELTFRWE